MEFPQREVACHKDGWEYIIPESVEEALKFAAGQEQNIIYEENQAAHYRGIAAIHEREAKRSKRKAEFFRQLAKEMDQ